MRGCKTLALLIIFISCSEKETISLSTKEFEKLLNTTAVGWSTQNTEMALSSFSKDAIYMEPPSSQLYRGHEELEPFFDALNATHKMTFHNIWFNEKEQTGVGEFTFSYGSDTASVGVVIVELTEGKISFWREYFTEGPKDFDQFLKVDGKEWDWTIDDY